jgi:paraquat-inducible protein B
MSALPEPAVSRRPSLSLVWMVPVVALIVGGWMMWGQHRHRGPEITVEFADGSGIEPGKTILDYKGVAVGRVRGLTLNGDLSGVIVRVRLDEGAAALAREGARFWIVQPEIGLTGVRGLDTLLTGVRLSVRPGAGPPASHFKGLSKPPPAEGPSGGRSFLLQADRLGSLSPGAPVLYRELKVGVVESSRLADDAASVLVQISVQPAYGDLVRINSRFWKAGGASVRVGLRGAEVKSSSLESLLVGGVAFATPDTGRQLGAIAPEGHVFMLHGDAEREWLRWQPRIRIGRGEADSAPAPPTEAAPADTPPAEPP